MKLTKYYFVIIFLVINVISCDNRKDIDTTKIPKPIYEINFYNGYDSSNIEFNKSYIDYYNISNDKYNIMLQNYVKKVLNPNSKFIRLYLSKGSYIVSPSENSNSEDSIHICPHIPISEEWIERPIYQSYYFIINKNNTVRIIYDEIGISDTTDWTITAKVISIIRDNYNLKIEDTVIKNFNKLTEKYFSDNFHQKFRKGKDTLEGRVGYISTWNGFIFETSVFYGFYKSKLYRNNIKVDKDIKKLIDYIEIIEGKSWFYWNEKI